MDTSGSPALKRIGLELLSSPARLPTRISVQDEPAKGLVAHTGLEPVISALRGQRVNELHQCAARKRRLIIEACREGWQTMRPVWLARSVATQFQNRKR